MVAGRFVDVYQRDLMRLVHQFMKSQGVRQSDLAQLLGLNASDVSNRFCGKIRLSVSEFAERCDRLHISPADVLRLHERGDPL